jgi:hypothetical protein
MLRGSRGRSDHPEVWAERECYPPLSLAPGDVFLYLRRSVIAARSLSATTATTIPSQLISLEPRPCRIDDMRYPTLVF